MSLTSDDLPDPLTPVTAVNVPSGNDTSTFLRLFACAPSTVIIRSESIGRRIGGGRDLLAAGEVVAGERTRVLHEVGVAAAVHDGAAVHAGARTDVDDPVGRADRVLVVLDDDERVAEVAEGDERVDEATVVALVEPDARLVEHVEHAREAGPDLGGEPDALRLAAGQRAAARARSR